MSVYRAKGVLTGTIEPENVATANDFLHEDKMAEWVAANASLEGLLVWLVWDLASDGHAYTITAVTTRDLDDDELKRLSEECSGQNSDGLGESFEQQDFAWDEDSADEDCGECNGRGWVRELDDDGDDVQVDCGSCGGDGTFYHDGGRMISFDWETNKLDWERVK